MQFFYEERKIIFFIPAFPFYGEHFNFYERASFLQKKDFKII